MKGIIFLSLVTIVAIVAGLFGLFTIEAPEAGKLLNVYADSTDLTNTVHATEIVWTQIPLSRYGASRAIIMLGVSGSGGGTGTTVRGFAGLDGSADPSPEMISYRMADDVAGVVGLTWTASGDDSLVASISFGDTPGLLPPYLVLKLAEDKTSGTLWVKIWFYE